ncbi:SGT1 protein-domain-containing protein [Cantharellus anzutake]|uniref:SGT1 protein-domain-containing protein n=1 Tax=Cantharellus anzutake TaxID=1750568 RepID=UPI001908034A|nr:SGT1 protein-domain-containing protein [Cantharellus anzutake]KAF8328807.1 SGT1 protein-domain-containing protein [Cantharellus anzutake]
MRGSTSGTDIFNQPPSISEDTVQYTFYPNPSVSISESSCVVLGAQIRETVHSRLPTSFLWHKDAFEVKLARALPNEAPSRTPRWKLEGTVRIGDSIDDEWCLVWLLREVSLIIDVAISISDSDGEFLLIEAADVLPKWISPANSENRVWIFQSQIHLIPIHFVSTPDVPRVRRHGSLKYINEEEPGLEMDNESYISVIDALETLRDSTIETVAPHSMHLRVDNKIKSYPQACHNHTHLTRAFLPLDIALALSEESALVQRAVEAFYTRDAIQLRPVYQMSRFPPSSSIFASIRMTRIAYAQLVSQNFHPPKIFGRWSEKEGSRDWQAKSLGMKIACGFEMLYAETKSKASVKTNKALALGVTKDALALDKGYQEYIRTLAKLGYFDHELEGSQKWREAENRAVRAWLDVRKADETGRLSFAENVNVAVEKAKKHSELTVFDRGEDPDEWMTASPDDLGGLFDGLQSSTQVTLAENEEDPTVADQASKLKKLAGRVEQFVQREGDLEGAKFDDDEVLDDLSDGESLNLSDEDGWASAGDEPMDAAARARVMDDLVPPLPASEYGALPAKYSNSRPIARRQPMSTSEDPTMDSCQSKPIRKPIFQRDKFDGVDSDDESDPDDDLDFIPCDDSEEDEDRPTVVGEIEVDMEAEKEDFIQFTRDILGISTEQWDDIVKVRQERGAFVPNLPGPTSEIANGPHPPDLHSFESLMTTMDSKLQQAQPARTSQKGKERALPPFSSMSPTFEDDESLDIEARMEAELLHAIEHDSDSEDENMEPNKEYDLIKNFLKSYAAQDGLSGPVSNLVGRLNESSSKET